MLDALFTESKQRILALFLMRPEERYHLREVARRIGMAVGTVQEPLASLEQAGILTRTVDGNRTYYQANRECAIYPELRRIMLKTAGLADVLREKMGLLAGKIEAAFVYGSMASGGAGPESDVDLMVVGKVDDMQLHVALGEAEGTLGRAVNYTLMAVREFKERRAKEEGFLSRVLSGPRLAVLGDPDDI